MKWLGGIERSIALLFFVAIFAFQGRGQAEPQVSGNRGQAVRTLQRYLHLRRQDADWKKYSKFVTWPDEPSWDCKWVESNHKVGAPIKNGQQMVIPVVHTRLGLFCYDFDFKPEPKVETIEYELASQPKGWRVSGPIPDYPDIGADVLLKSLNTTAANMSETPGRRAEAETTARKITQAIKHQTASSRSRTD